MGSDPSCATVLELAQTIVTGLPGKAADEGGTGTAVLGVLPHVLMALSWTVAFFHFYINLVQHAVVIGLPMVLLLGHPASDHQRRHR